MCCFNGPCDHLYLHSDRGPDASPNYAFGINNSSNIVGTIGQHGFLDIGGTFAWIDFPGASQTVAFA